MMGLNPSGPADLYEPIWAKAYLTFLTVKVLSSRLFLTVFQTIPSQSFFWNSKSDSEAWPSFFSAGSEQNLSFFGPGRNKT